jgi:hypothetical protein
MVDELKAIKHCFHFTVALKRTAGVDVEVLEGFGEVVAKKHALVVECPNRIPGNKIKG